MLLSKDDEVNETIAKALYCHLNVAENNNGQVLIMGLNLIGTYSVCLANPEFWPMLSSLNEGICTLVCIVRRYNR